MSNPGKSGQSRGGASNSSSKTPTIKIASKDAAKRNAGADVGPGDPLAAPSVAPELVEIPSPNDQSSSAQSSGLEPPDLEVSAGGGGVSDGGGAGGTDSRPTRSSSGGAGGGASSLADLGKSGPQKISSKGLSAGRESTAVDVGPGDPQAAPSVAPVPVDIPRPPTQSELVVKSGASKSGASQSGKSLPPPRFETIKSTPKTGGSKPKAELAVKTLPKPESLLKSAAGLSAKMGSGSGPGSELKPSLSPKSTDSAAKSSGSSAAKSGGSSAAKSSSSIAKSSSGSAAPAAPKSAESAAKSAGSTASQKSDADMDAKSESPVVKSAPDAAVVKPASRSKSKSPRDASSERGPGARKHGNKVTKFRYHKRITVRTHGKTSPSAIMDKVRKKDTITPSTIEDMDPQELIQKAGIKGGKNTHWRIRLRQTKRLTKGGKTVTQTKVAYRDSQGHKHVKTSTDPDCKKCGKKLEDCRCNESEQ